MQDASSFPQLPDFDIRECLARGGMAEVYLAHVLSGGLRDTDVILKRLLPLHAHDPAYVSLFVAEARLGERFVHPNIAQTYELIQRGDELFMVQEYVEGCTLGELFGLGDVPQTALAAALDDLLQALEFLHAGGGIPGGPPIIHRDVNPDNLVIRSDGVAKLIDFGIAEIEGKPDAERIGALAGTTAYMSPEQARGDILDRRSDVFSAGIVLWESLAGIPLYHRTTEFETLRTICDTDPPPLATVAPEVRVAFEPVLTRALARDREDRFESAAEMLSGLERAYARAGTEFDRTALSEAVARVAAAAPSTASLETFRMRNSLQ
jgi:serine/threonine-protein kinase